jgi:tetratricopeptide (TPR) repeat protein
VPAIGGSAQPELVQHVTLNSDLLKQTEAALSIVVRALSRGNRRFWTCGECKAVNPYPGYERQLAGGPPPEKTYTFVKQDITDPEKQFAMGCTFFHGEKVPQDYKEANKWFRKAAEQGHREAQFFLAVNYHGGHGVQEDTTEAYRWYVKAAEQGHRSAQRTVGIAYLNGEIMRKDIGAGVRWLEKAAHQGDGGALYNLGVCYYNGQGVQQDDRKALDLFKRAAAAGHDGAVQLLKQMGSP